MKAHRLAGLGMDRLAAARRDPDWVTARLRDRHTRILPLWRSRNLVRGAASPAPVALTAARLSASGLAWTEPVLLGALGERAYFAVDLPAEDAAVAERLAAHGRFFDLRQLAAVLDPADAALLGYARAMTYWHRHHRFCADCGAPSESRDGGALRVCSACSRAHFPRTDPAVITLVTARDACLLGRQHGWPERMYSTLAGFVEPGESAEEAVSREVAEETGVRVSAVRYHSSQPWPFPGSLMIGFRARARRGALRVDPRELEAARWFSRRALREAVGAGDVRLPQPFSIAHFLITEWLQGR